MKVEIELTKRMIKMLERFRSSQIAWEEQKEEQSTSETFKKHARKQIKFYEEANYETLTFEYLLHQAIAEIEKTD